jgi:hypothetical protein
VNPLAAARKPFFGYPRAMLLKSDRSMSAMPSAKQAVPAAALPRTSRLALIARRRRGGDAVPFSSVARIPHHAGVMKEALLILERR